MQKLKKIFSPRKMILWVTIIIFIISFQFSNQPAQSKTQAIVTALAVDEVEENLIEVSTVVLTPVQETPSKRKAYSAQGINITTALDNIALQLGKEIAFGQCDIMALGDNLCEENALKALDYLTRTKRVGRNAVLINFSGTTEDFANCVIQLNDNMSLSIAEIINANEKRVTANETNIETFYKGYYSDLSTSIMPKIAINEEASPNAIKINVEGGNSTNSSSNVTTSSSNNKEVYFLNDGTTSVFKEGKKVGEILPDEVKYINLLQPQNILGTFKLQNVTTDLFTNAEVVINMINKDVSYKLSFENGLPKITYTLDLYIIIDEIIESEKSEDLLYTENWFVDKNLVNALQNKIIENLDIGITKLKSEQIDILNIYDKFYKFKNKQFEKYLNTLDDKQNFLQNIQFNYKVNINSSY